MLITKNGRTHKTYRQQREGGGSVNEYLDKVVDVILILATATFIAYILISL